MDTSRYLAVGDTTCSVEGIDQLLIVDTRGMSENDLDWIETMGAIPDGFPVFRLGDLLADAFRYQAIFHAPHDPEYCASCELAGNDSTRIDVDSAPVVRWDVMGDPRAVALVCDGCYTRLTGDTNRG